MARKPEGAPFPPPSPPPVTPGTEGQEIMANDAVKQAADELLAIFEEVAPLGDPAEAALMALREVTVARDPRDPWGELAELGIVLPAPAPPLPPMPSPPPPQAPLPPMPEPRMPWSLIDHAGVTPDELPRWEPPEPLVPEEDDGWMRVRVHFETEEDVREFARRLGVHVGPDTRVVWWPPPGQRLEPWPWPDSLTDGEGNR